MVNVYFSNSVYQCVRIYKRSETVAEIYIGKILYNGNALHFEVFVTDCTIINNIIYSFNVNDECIRPEVCNKIQLDHLAGCMNRAIRMSLS